MANVNHCHHCCVITDDATWGMINILHVTWKKVKWNREKGPDDQNGVAVATVTIIIVTHRSEAALRKQLRTKKHASGVPESKRCNVMKVEKRKVEDLTKLLKLHSNTSNFETIFAHVVGLSMSFSTI